MKNEIEDKGTQAHYRHVLQRPMFQNNKGEWVPAIPEPYYHFIRLECECKKKFWTREAYNGHYTYRHIINPSPTNS